MSSHRPLAALVASAATAACLAGGLAAGPASAAPGAPSPGAPGVGDRLFPTLGNGGYDVRNYDLALRYPTAAPDGVVEGTVTLTAVATQALSRFNLDFAGRGLAAVTVDGRPATFARQGEELVITPARPIGAGRPFVVAVRGFTAVPTPPDGEDPLTTAIFRASHGTASAAQPNGLHAAIPSNDHPSDKASWTFRFDVPAGTTAVGNGVLLGKRATGERAVWTYRMAEPMATELVQLAVGRLTVTDRGRRHGVRLRDVTPSDRTADLAPKLAAEKAHLDWMVAKVGRYPFDTYGSFPVVADLGFALETQTLSIFDSRTFEGDDPSEWEPTMVHELTHQWFGNSVAPDTWSDLWLGEGHATWYETLYSAEKGWLDGTFDEYFREVYAEGDAWRAEYGPVGAPRNGTVEGLYTPQQYDGGALVLYALRQEIGAAAFAKLERAWVQRYAGRSVDTADLAALASKIAGRDLRPFLQAWVYGTTTPPMPGRPDWTVAEPAGASASVAAALRPFQRR